MRLYLSTILATDNMSISLADVEPMGTMLGYETDVPGLGHVEFLTDPGGAPIGLELNRAEQKPPLGLTGR